MRIASQKINQSGVVISRQKVHRVMEKYIKTYNRVAEQLFNFGYLSSPSYFDEAEFWKTFFDEYPSLDSIFCDNLRGSTVLTSEHINYVSRVINDEEAKHTLQLAEEITRASEAIKDLNNLLELVKFKKKSDLVTVKARFSVSNRIFNSGKIPLDSPYVFECYHLDDGYKLVSVDYSFEIYKTLLKKLNIDDEVDLDSDSLFLGGSFKVSDECAYLNMLVSGEIKGCGKYADLLYNTVEKYYSDYYKSRTTIAYCLEFSDQNFIDSTPNCIEAVNNFRKTLPIDAVPFYLDNSKVYFKISGVADTHITSYKEFYIGTFLSDAYKRESIGVMPQLLGFCGEFVSETDAVVNNYKTSGVPITIPSLIGQVDNASVLERNYFPIYNIKRQVNDKLVDIYPTVNVETILFKDFDDILESLEVTKETLVDEVASCVKRKCCEHQTLFNRLVGYLFQALLCVMCDYTLDGHESPNHVILGDDYDWLTDDIFREACVETEILFRKLGF